MTPSKLSGFFSPGKLKIPSMFSKRGEASPSKDPKEHDVPNAVSTMSPVTEASPAGRVDCAPMSDRMSMYDGSPAAVSAAGLSPVLEGGWALAALLPSPKAVGADAA